MASSRHAAPAFRPVSLTYSSPLSTPPSPIPARFYNAFPDLNDVVPDGLRAAFPQRAKYCLALDSEFIPAGINRANATRRTALLAKLGSKWVDSIGEVAAMQPRYPVSAAEMHFQQACEIGHKRLAATGSKWALRAYHLAAMYTELERCIALRQPIAVPLLEDHRGSPLQRHWNVVAETFRQTQAVDEAISLLVGLSTLDAEVAAAWEPVWMATQEEEVSGFMPIFEHLRQRFQLEECRTPAERDALAEQVLQWGKRELAGTKRPHRPRLRKDLAIGWSGLPAAIQRLLAYRAVTWDQRKSFARDDYWPGYVGFDVIGGADENHASVSAPVLGDLYLVIKDGLPHVGGRPIDNDTLIVAAHYTVWIEALRQQICTGVGLCCPFWDGSTCCGFNRAFMQTAYQITMPWNEAWASYWHKPLCLD